MSKPAMDKVVEHAKSKGHEEVVGVLIGSVIGQTVVVEDAITGRIESTATRAVLPPDTIARIADDILKQRIQGNIVGWYHSHPGYGIFMSNVDIATQTKLQQFSPYVTALIIDPSTDQVGFFTLDASGTPQSIPPENVRIFGEGEEPAPPEFEVPIESRPIPFEEVPAPVSVPRRRTRYLLVVILLVIIAVGLLGNMVFLIQPRQVVIPVITHTERTTTTTQTLSSIVELWLVVSRTRPVTITDTITTGTLATKTTRTLFEVVNETRTSWSSTTVVVTTTITSVLTITSISNRTIWTTLMAPPGTGISAKNAANRTDDFLRLFFCSGLAVGVFALRRQYLLLRGARIDL